MQIEGAHYHKLVFNSFRVNKDGILFMRTFCVVIGRAITLLSKGLLKCAICVSSRLELKFGLLLRVVKV